MKVIYYVTAQISKDPLEDSADYKAATQSSSSQVSHVNASDKPQNHQQVSTDGSSEILNKDPDKIFITPSDRPFKPFARPSSQTLSKPQLAVKKPLVSPTQGTLHVVKVPLVQVSIEEKVESPTSVCTPVLLSAPNFIPSQATENSNRLSSANQTSRSTFKVREKVYKEIEDNGETFLSPDLPGEEPPPPPPPDNIAFMITNTKVQALSTGEYQELVNAKKGNVQTVTVGNRPKNNGGNDSGLDVFNSNDPMNAETGGCYKKPVIIIFDEPMDIRSAYKRLSTIFECEEEIERMLAEERIDEESEENEDEDIRNVGVLVKQNGDEIDCGKTNSGGNTSSVLLSDTVDVKQDVKKKFKFKFPKKQLAALTQAIRTGTKTGKKTLQVVVYEDEEEADGIVKHKETKRFEVHCPKQEPVKLEPVNQECNTRTDEIRKSTYKTLDSLEQTIRQLETTISEMGPKSVDGQQCPEFLKHQSQASEVLNIITSQKTMVPKSSSSSTRSSPRKKPKPQLLPRPAAIPSTGVCITPAPTPQVSL